MSLAQEMWDYLKSIGFEDIPDNDERLGNAVGVWDLNIANGSLCAYQDIDTIKEDDWIFLIDNTNENCDNVATDDDLNIHSVADLEAWLRKEYPEFFTIETPSTKQHKYKVGDKVRILEDATYYDETSVLERGAAKKTAIGEMGVVNNPTRKGVGL